MIRMGDASAGRRRCAEARLALRGASRLAVPLALLSSCAPDRAASPTRTTDVLAVEPYVDLDPDPRVVEVTMVAAVGDVEIVPGTLTAAWGYRDGSRPDAPLRVPGPLLEANEGDLVRVHFRNELPWSTTVHWHGPRIPNAMDGSPSTQGHVVPGGAFDYEFVVRDVGTFWYHPHLLADVELERGLFGPLVVRGGSTIDVAADRILVLDDVKLGEGGAFDATVSEDDVVYGRRGTTLLVNGKPGAFAPAAAGSRERWRFINAANGRPFELALPGHRFRVIGWDGGLLPAPYEAETLPIAPGERYEVLVDLEGDVGSAVTLLDVSPGRPGLPPSEPAGLLTFRFDARASAPPLPLPAGPLRPIEPLRVSDETPVRKVTLSGPQVATTGLEFRLNGQRWPFSAPVTAALGATEVWLVENLTALDEPFHLHGVFFQVLKRGAAPETRLGWKDTAVVPAGGTLRFAVTYGEPGMWMFHSHVLEHAERGMMGDLMVE